jgi:hypothetical protein
MPRADALTSAARTSGPFTEVSVRAERASRPAVPVINRTWCCASGAGLEKAVELRFHILKF